MTNIKFTGANIAAALLILAYFFPWVSGLPGISMSGFKMTTTGISPGMLGMFVSGINRLLMVLLIIVPLSGALILYQNITGNKKYDKYFKLAHILPAALLMAGIVLLYFKMKPETPEFANGAGDEFARSLGNSRSMLEDMAPGLFDILSLGVYASLLAGVYLLLVSMGKIKDKEYYKPISAKMHQNNDDVSA